MAGERCRHDPLVVRLVKTFVDERVMQVSMDPVDAKIGKDEEERELKNVVPEAGALVCSVVELAVASDFDEEDGCRANGHERHCFVCLDNFKPDLALDEPWVVYGALVKDEIEGERRKDEVDQQSKEPGMKHVRTRLMQAARTTNHVMKKSVMIWRTG